MAATASHCESHPNSACRVDPVDYVFDGVLRSNDAAFIVDAVISIESRGQNLALIGIRQHVSGQLLNCKLIERHIVVEGIDHPVAPWPHEAFPVRLVATCVGVTSRLQPRQCHVFAVVRRRQ